MYSTYPTISKTATPTATVQIGTAPTYDELVIALRLIEHATSPTHDDGAYHEAAHDLATQALSRPPATAVVAPDELRRFLSVAAGEGYVFDGVDAGDLFLKLFPDAFHPAT